MVRSVFRGSAELIEVQGLLRPGAETDKAVMLLREGREYWFPYSHVKEVHRTYDSKGYDSLIVTVWIAKQKGLL